MADIVIGFTGTREGLTAPQAAALRRWLEYETPYPDAAHHGSCVGADAEFHEIVGDVWPRAWRHRRPSHFAAMTAECPGDNVKTHPARSPLVRNHDIVDACDVLLACPKGMKEEARSGTWATIRHARKRGRRIVLFFPDGSVKEEASKCL